MGKCGSIRAYVCAYISPPLVQLVQLVHQKGEYMNKQQEQHKQNQTDRQDLKRVYQIILVDPIWDIWEVMGFYDDLNSPHLKKRLKDVIVQNLLLDLEGGNVKLTGVDQENWGTWLEDNIEVPDNFIHEYAGTFSVCIDRPYISYQDIYDECFHNKEGVTLDSGDYDIEDNILSVRGFVMEWPKALIDALSDWEADEITPRSSWLPH